MSRPALALTRAAAPGDLPEHHTDRGFRNPPGSPAREPGWEREMGAFLKRLNRRRRQPVPLPDGHVLSPEAALAGLAAAEGRDSVTWLGHAAFLIRLGGRTILCDPWLSDHASPLRGFGPRRYAPPGIPVDRLPPVDLLLLSHCHYDHLCTRTLKALPGRHGVPAAVPLGLGRMLHRLGYRTVAELDWHDRLETDGVSVTALPAIHGSARGLFDRDRTLWCSYLLEAGGRRLWFGGDSAHGPVFAELGERYGPVDLAIVGVGAYQPRSIMRAVHADPEEGIAIARDLRAARVLGMHWGTVLLTEEDPFEPPARFGPAAQAAGYAEADAWLLRIGETRLL